VLGIEIILNYRKRIKKMAVKRNIGQKRLVRPATSTMAAKEGNGAVVRLI
jgi:hypothetical protein